MIHKRNKIIAVISLISVVILFSRCQSEETEIANKKASVISAKEWLENNEINLEALAYTETIDWDNAIETDGENGKMIEVPLKLKANTSTNVVLDENYKTYMRLLFVEDREDTYHVFNIVYTTKDDNFNNANKEQNFYHIDSHYSGYITFQNSINKIIYSGVFDNGMVIGLHNSSRETSKSAGLVCRYWVYVGPTVTCSNWVWEPDIIIGGGGFTFPPGIGGPIYVPPFKLDPCASAKTTSGISAASTFLKAKSDILQASADGNEHSITLGKDAKGVLNQAPMNNGGTNGVNVNQTWASAFAAIHNHPNETPLSSGDIYTAVSLNTKNGSFNTSFILTGGETYAIVVTDLKAAQAFIAAYPADLSPNYPPEFPQVLFDQIQDIKTKFGESNEARTMAISLVLDNNNSGITLMKQDSNGNFNRIKIQQTTNSDGSKTFSSVPCN